MRRQYEILNPKSMGFTLVELLVVITIIGVAIGQAPAQAIGFGSWDPNLDVLPGFQKPPPGFGIVAFYWWVGDPLTKERLLWQLDRLAGMGITGLQINYAHTDKGGLNCGLSVTSDPPLFSEQWWVLVGWFMQEAKKRGMAVSLSDYTLGLGQGFFMDAALRENPDLCGQTLSYQTIELTGGKEHTQNLSAGWVSVSAFRRDGQMSQSAVDLRGAVRGETLRWVAPPGEWRVITVVARRAEMSIDAMNPKSGPAVIKHFFQRFEDRFPGECGQGLNFFFSDELDFRLRGMTWNDCFAAEFQRRKGYDIVPELAALFADIGPRTPKIRLDYNDVRVAMSEEGYFKPVFDWHQSRGMIYGCDHGGRGRDVVEFGDYFRTQRWNQGPGCDQPWLGCDIIKNKVASSIAHLYQRPRVWLEGYHSSGWGTSSAQVSDATFVNFLAGHNLLTLHGLYYSTHGGWWEWAPPCNHWRMPYWEHMGIFMHAVERLSYLLSQGVHVCDVAVIYPVAAKEAGMDGDASVDTAFNCGQNLYAAGTDFDFMDFESLALAKVADGKLNVSGEAYRVLVLPAMKVVRHSTLEKVAEFARNGGIVAVVGALPQATDRAGGNDPEVEWLLRDIFGVTAAEAAAMKGSHRKDHTQGGVGLVVGNPTALVECVAQTLSPDLKLASGVPRAYVHRRIGPREVYGLLGPTKGTECFFRARGRAELWDVWTGDARPLPVLEQTVAGTRLRLPLEADELQLVIFTPGEPIMDDRQPFPKKVAVPVAGDWECEIKPTLDNRWGDFRWPAFDGLIGAEVRKFRYMRETSVNPAWEKRDIDDSHWPRVTYAFGPMFWKLGPFPVDGNAAALEAKLASFQQIDAVVPEHVDGKSYNWTSYDFSWRWGVEGDPGHQGYHGLKEEMYDEFIRLGKLVDQHPAYVREREEGGTRYYLWTTIAAPQAMNGKFLISGMRPAAIWMNGRKLNAETTETVLRQGPNSMLLRYDGAGTGYIVVVDPASPLGSEPDNPISIIGTLAMRWHGAKGIFPFDIRPGETKPAGWYRFKTAPGTKAMTLVTHGNTQCWVNGKECRRSNLTGGRLRFDLPETAKDEAVAALRIEQERGLYGGAAVPEPVAFECDKGLIGVGDWSRLEGLESYSGGLSYRKTIVLTADEIQGSVVLDLGKVVSSAEVRVNGQPSGVRVVAPWRWDVTRLVKPGENRIEVLVYNTLANQYLTTPTRYRGSPVSGLIGPVSIEFCARPDGRSEGGEPPLK